MKFKIYTLFATFLCAGLIVTSTEAMDQKENDLSLKKWRQKNQQCFDKELFEAIKNNNLNLIKILLRLGANVNTKDEEEVTPLHYAAFYGNRDVITCLINKGASLYATNCLNQKPINYVCANQPNIRILLKNLEDLTEYLSCF